MELNDSEALTGPVGTACSGTGGYSDQTEGTQGTVTNETGRGIRLGAHRGGNTTSLRTCTFLFVVTGLPPAQVYSIEAAHRGQLHYTPAELDQENWSVSLTLGQS